MAMPTASTKPMTAEEFFDWTNRTENRDKYCELERGEIVEITRPGKRHGFVCANLVRILQNYCFARKKGYVCANDTGIVLERDPDTVRGPDVTLYEDVEQYDKLDLKWAETPPLLAVEVLSPNDTMGKIMRRVREQLDFGTKMVWIVDPEARNLTIHQPAREPLILEEDQELPCDEFLPGFRCKVAAFLPCPARCNAFSSKPTDSFSFMRE
jgi:Uma2 family endonuclease